MSGVCIDSEYCGQPPNGCARHQIIAGCDPSVAPCDCYEAEVFPDGTKCSTTEVADGVCFRGECTVEEPEGCGVSGVGLLTGSMAPILAALFLLATRRRARQDE